MHRLHQDLKLVNLCNPVSVSTAGNVTPIAVDGSGFDRIAICAARGTQTGATKNTFRLSLYKSATTGGTYSKVASSDGTMASTASSKAGVIIDASIDPDKPHMKVYGTGGGLGTSAYIAALVAVLYRGSRSLPPTQEYTTAPVIIA